MRLPRDSKTKIAPCRLTVVLLMLFLLQFHTTRSQTLLVCGDYKVLLVDYQKSRDSIPQVTWTWDAHQSKDLPEELRLERFNSIDDCKAVNNGKDILVSSSGGAVAIVEVQSGKVSFYAEVPNAHSVELLPGNLLVAAASTHHDGNKLMVFDLENHGKALYTDGLYSAHGVVWISGRKTLFALGYDVLREYGLGKNMGDLVLQKQWRIPGEGGHDLQLSPDSKHLFLSEHHGVWKFDLATENFSKISGFPDAANIKSVGLNSAGQFIFTIPEKSWWTYHVSFHRPTRRLAFPDMKVYKARWFAP